MIDDFEVSFYDLSRVTICLIKKKNSDDQLSCLNIFIPSIKNKNIFRLNCHYKLRKNPSLNEKLKKQRN